MRHGPRYRIGLSALAFAFALCDAHPARSQNAYYPATVDPGRGPEWERPKLTRFSATRCGPGSIIDEVTLSRDDQSKLTGFATYTDAGRDKGHEHGAGGWSLDGERLRVEGDGFVLEGRWVGAVLTATITRGESHPAQRCRYQVAALRSFQQFQ